MMRLASMFIKPVLLAASGFILFSIPTLAWSHPVKPDFHFHKTHQFLTEQTTNSAIPDCPNKPPQTPPPAPQPPTPPVAPPTPTVIPPTTPVAPTPLPAPSTPVATLASSTPIQSQVPPTQPVQETTPVLPDTASPVSSPNPILMVLVSLGLVAGLAVKRFGRYLGHS